MCDEKISIVIPIYNTEQYLDKCVDSVLNQTYKNLEVILVDDGSTDDSGKICDYYAAKDQRVVIIHQRNQGNNVARKNGVKIANGDYVGFVDSDDWIEPDMYQCMVDNIKKNNADIVSVGFYLENSNKTEIYNDEIDSNLYKIGKDTNKFIESVLLGNTKSRLYSIQWNLVTKLFKRNVISVSQEKVNGVFYGEDMAVTFESYYLADSISVINKPYYHYRQCNHSITHKKDVMLLSKLNEMYAYMKKLFVSKNAGCLIQQELDRYFIRTIDDVIPKVTGSEEIYNIKYLLPYKDKGKKIVLYGAGRIGKDFYKQVINAGMTCYWTDSNWEKIDNSCIISVEEALKKEFDKIVIAIKNEKIVQNVCNELKNKGVPESKIIWDIQTIYD